MILREYEQFERAYNHFNSELFECSLPPVLFTYQRKKKAYGFFCADRFEYRATNELSNKLVAHELAMNPTYFKENTEEEILSTLVHEMVHVWQQEEGTPPKNVYHNKEWARKMEEVGLMPSTTGHEGGKKTGVKCSHYIIENGPFQVAFHKLGPWKLSWQIADLESDKKPPAEKKVKYVCSGCELKVWAKTKACISCMNCEITMEEA